MDVSKFNANKYAKKQKMRKLRQEKVAKMLEERYTNVVDDLQKSRKKGLSGKGAQHTLNSKLKSLQITKKELKKQTEIRKKQQQKLQKQVVRKQPSLPKDSVIEAIALSALSNPIEKMGVPLLDALNAIIEAAKTARESIGEELLKFSLDLFTTLYNVYNNMSWKSILLNMTNFFYRNFSTRDAERAIQWLRQAFSYPVSQSEDSIDIMDQLKEIFDLSSNVMSDVLWTHLVDFISKMMTMYMALKSLVSIDTLDLTTVTQKFKKFLAMKDTGRDLISMCFEAYTFIAGHWEQILKGNWEIFLLGKDEAEKFEFQVRKLEQAYNMVLSRREVALKTDYGWTLETYETELEDSIKQAKKLSVQSTSQQMRLSLSNFVKKMMDMQAAIWASKADAPSKEEAYAIKMSGPSSCGKSTMIKLMSKTILNAYGRDHTRSGQVVSTNIDENYESTILPSHKIIVADDVANNINNKPNYDRLLNYVNTVPRPLEKAGVEEKGKFYPANDALIVTTNDESIRATACSVCPESILRRFALDVDVKIREEYRNNFGGLIKQDTINFSVYELILKRFSHLEEQPDGPPIIIWDVIPRVEWNKFDDNLHDFHAMCSFIASDIRRHRTQQKRQKAVQDSLDSCAFCPHCQAPTIVCACTTSTCEVVSDEDEFDSESDEESDSDSEEPIAEVQFGMVDIFQQFSTRELYDLRSALTNAYQTSVQMEKILRLAYTASRDKAIIYKLLGYLIVLPIVAKLLPTPFYFGLMTLITTSGIYTLKKLIDRVDSTIANRTDQLSCLCEDIYEHLRTNAKTYFVISSSVFAAYALYKAMRPLFLTQDKTTYFDQFADYFAKNVSAPAEGEHKFTIQDERDYKEGYSRMPPKGTHSSETTTSKDLQQALARNLRVVITKSKGQSYGTVNGLMVASNVIMIPAHAVPYTFPFDIETTSTPGVPSARTKDQKLTEEYCYIDREKDQAFIHLASSPASRDMSGFFPKDYPTFYSRSTALLWKSHYNEVKVSKQAARPTTEDLRYAGYLEHPGTFWGQQHKLTLLTLKAGKGLKYDTEFHGFGGLCGAMLVDANIGMIYGYHVAGIPGRHTGWSTCVLQGDIQRALSSLKKTSPTLVPHSSDDVIVNTYGRPYELVNQKPLYTREDGTQDKTTVTYLGTVLKEGLPMQGRARPPYMKTPFEGVAEQLGERKHRPPRDPNDVSKGMITLNKLTDPVQHYEGDILAKALKDYEEHTITALSQDNELSDMLRIYTQEEAMDGIGEFGLGGLPNDTSAGFPIDKSKKHCLLRDADDESLVKVPREFNDTFDIQAEIDRTMNAWSNNTRSEAIYKASSKVNELLLDEKANEKPRKFYGSGFANFVASRRVIAGIPRVMKKHWKTTECTVGINPLSKEWDDFHAFLTEYSITNMIAGDFSGFDTRMAAQITAGAAKIMVSWYRLAGCSEEEIRLVEGALSDIIHPNIIFDGDLYRFANGNPSGNLITVQLNSICNSIMMRYVYYSQMPNIRQPFASNVRLGTYGDDNAMSVKRHCSWYTHTSCQQEFAKLDIKYTMADKGAKSRPYIGIEEISFLKRNFHKHPELNKMVGIIEEDSIIKKFHWVKKPSECPLSASEQFGAYTDGAFREKYLYGRDQYNQFQQKIRNIVELNDDLRGVINFIPYDEMTQILKPYYADSYKSGNDLKLYAEGGCLDELDSLDI